MFTHLEDFIYRLYISIGISAPEDLDMFSIARKLGLTINYDEEKVFWFSREINLKRSTKRQEWMDFGHELCHFLRHCGNQAGMNPLFRELQEYQAEYFAYHFCVPTFMLQNLKEVSVHVIMNLFNVDYDFAMKRLAMYESKIIMKGVDQWQKVMLGREKITSGN